MIAINGTPVHSFANTLHRRVLKIYNSTKIYIEKVLEVYTRWLNRFFYSSAPSLKVVVDRQTILPHCTVILLK